MSFRPRARVLSNLCMPETLLLQYNHCRIILAGGLGLSAEGWLCLLSTASDLIDEVIRTIEGLTQLELLVILNER